METECVALHAKLVIEMQIPSALVLRTVPKTRSFVVANLDFMVMEKHALLAKPAIEMQSSS